MGPCLDFTLSDPVVLVWATLENSMLIIILFVVRMIVVAVQ